MSDTDLFTPDGTARELEELRGVADTMARALKRGPFEGEHQFGERRKLAYEAWETFTRRKP